jgi:hypothetical protein
MRDPVLLQPTMALRFLERVFTVDQDVKLIRILQQQFRDPVNGQLTWRDVPLEQEFCK